MMQLDSPRCAKKTCVIETKAKAGMTKYSDDIYTEPSNVDCNTLANLGPLTKMAGIW